jgi:hypothetical protein
MQFATWLALLNTFTRDRLTGLFSSWSSVRIAHLWVRPCLPHFFELETRHPHGFPKGRSELRGLHCEGSSPGFTQLGPFPLRHPPPSSCPTFGIFPQGLLTIASTIPSFQLAGLETPALPASQVIYHAGLRKTNFPGHPRGRTTTRDYAPLVQARKWPPTPVPGF